jgi:hypothetical protein
VDWTATALFRSTYPALKGATCTLSSPSFTRAGGSAPCLSLANSEPAEHWNPRQAVHKFPQPFGFPQIVSMFVKIVRQFKFCYLQYLISTNLGIVLGPCSQCER